MTSIEERRNKQWLAPAKYRAAATVVMGGIDSDIDTEEWNGRLYLEMPRRDRLEYAQRLVSLVERGEVTEAVVLAVNATETRWYRAIAGISSAWCLHAGRIRFTDKEGGTNLPIQGQVILYVGSNTSRFSEVFSDFGTILTPIKE